MPVVAGRLVIYTTDLSRIMAKKKIIFVKQLLQYFMEN